MENLYRVILCRYNEIGLKSETYQHKILGILSSSIKSICSRENLHLQSILMPQGRILCFFPPDEIPKALKILRHIIGIQSLSPAISSPRKLYKIAEAAGKLLQAEYPSFYSPEIEIRKGVPVKWSDNELRSKIMNLLSTANNKQEKLSNQLLNSPILSIEVREKGTYLYTRKIPTVWAGFPIETSNALLAYWQDTPLNLVACALMLRRGAIISPVTFSDSPLPKNLSLKTLQSDGKINLLSLEYLAKFYPADLPLLALSISPLIEYLSHTYGNRYQENHTEILYRLKLWIMEELITENRRQAIVTYNTRNLHYKGVIFPYHHEDIDSKFFTELVQQSGLLGLFPLAGLNTSLTSEIYATLIQTELNPTGENDDDFNFSKSYDSYSSILEKEFDVNAASPISVQTKNRQHLSADGSEIFWKVLKGDAGVKGLVKDIISDLQIVLFKGYFHH